MKWLVKSALIIVLVLNSCGKDNIEDLFGNSGMIVENLGVNKQDSTATVNFNLFKEGDTRAALSPYYCNSGSNDDDIGCSGIFVKRNGLIYRHIYLGDGTNQQFIYGDYNKGWLSFRPGTYTFYTYVNVKKSHILQYLKDHGVSELKSCELGGYIFNPYYRFETANKNKTDKYGYPFMFYRAGNEPFYGITDVTLSAGSNNVNIYLNPIFAKLTLGMNGTEFREDNSKTSFLTGVQCYCYIRCNKYYSIWGGSCSGNEMVTACTELCDIREHRFVFSGWGYTTPNTTLTSTRRVFYVPASDYVYGDIKSITTIAMHAIATTNAYYSYSTDNFEIASRSAFIPNAINNSFTSDGTFIGYVRELAKVGSYDHSGLSISPTFAYRPYYLFLYDNNYVEQSGMRGVEVNYKLSKGTHLIYETNFMDNIFSNCSTSSSPNLYFPNSTNQSMTDNNYYVPRMARPENYSLSKVSLAYRK